MLNDDYCSLVSRAVRPVSCTCHMLHNMTTSQHGRKKAVAQHKCTRDSLSVFLRQRLHDSRIARAVFKLRRKSHALRTIHPVRHKWRSGFRRHHSTSKFRSKQQNDEMTLSFFSAWHLYRIRNQLFSVARRYTGQLCLYLRSINAGPVDPLL